MHICKTNGTASSAQQTLRLNTLTTGRRYRNDAYNYNLNTLVNFSAHFFYLSAAKMHRRRGGRPLAVHSRPPRRMCILSRRQIEKLRRKSYQAYNNWVHRLNSDGWEIKG